MFSSSLELMLCRQKCATNESKSIYFCTLMSWQVLSPNASYKNVSCCSLLGRFIWWGELDAQKTRAEQWTCRHWHGKKKSGSPVLPSEPRAELLGPRPENERREGQQERKNYFLLPSWVKSRCVCKFTGFCCFANSALEIPKSGVQMIYFPWSVDNINFTSPYK